MNSNIKLGKINGSTRNKILLVLLVVLSVLFISGCHKSPAQQLIGLWTIDTAKSGAAGSAISQHGGSTISFSKDQKFHLLEGKLPIDGSFSVSGQLVTLHLESFMGKDIAAMEKKANRPASANSVTANLSTDGKSLTLKVPSQGVTLIYDKK